MVESYYATFMAGWSGNLLLSMIWAHDSAFWQKIGTGWESNLFRDMMLRTRVGPVSSLLTLSADVSCEPKLGRI
jgi:hypothetical protein